MGTFDLIIIVMVSASLVMMAVAAGGMLQYHWTFKEGKKIDDFLADLYSHVDLLQQTNEVLLKSNKDLHNSIQIINESIDAIEDEVFDPEITAEMPVYKPGATAQLPVYDADDEDW
jgi:Tfp pilus assembly protein PilN